MYEQAEEELKKILALVELCPEPLRADAFKILLEGYVRASMPTAPAKTPQPDNTKAPPKPGEHLSAAIPPDVQARLGALAKRRNLSAEQLSGVFDFTTDPFTFAPLN